MSEAVGFTPDPVHVRERARNHVFLILHGTGGNSPDHWQEWLARELTRDGFDVRTPRFPNADTPKRNAWLKRLDEELATIPPDAHLTVLAHSRGCILWMHHAARVSTMAGRPVAERVLLVAPPYIVGEDYTSGFFPAPLSPEGTARVALDTAIIASDNDEYASFAEAESYAAVLRIPIYCLRGASHISPFYGYGAWPWVRNWCLGQADRPPISRFGP